MHGKRLTELTLLRLLFHKNMDENRNYLIFKFTNAVFIEIFGRYAENSELAEFIAEDGSVTMEFRMVNGVLNTPKTTEQFLSLMYVLFETNPESPAGRVYMAHQLDILRETVYRLNNVLCGFSDIHMTIHFELPDKDDPDNPKVTHTEFTLTRTQVTEKDK